MWISFCRQFWLFFILEVASGFVCVDPNGNNVDWYSIYKSPKIHDSPDKHVQVGVGHFYLDVHLPQWSLSGQSMNSSGQAVYNTLQQVYKPKGTMMFLMYNDEEPGSHESSSGGHTKGVVAFDGTSGFWLIHSTPRFPPRQADGYSWPCSGLDYGQTFLCVSLPTSQLNNVATQLLYNHPHIYDSQVPKYFLDKFPVLNAVLARKPVRGPPWSSIIDLKSVAGKKFTSFAKYTRFHADLYDDLVAPTLKQDLMVETWLRKDGTPLSSNCSAPYKVFKINSVSLPDNVTFRETKDHAKWAVAAPKSAFDVQGGGLNMAQATATEPWVCVGDINRMKSQFKRGGGTVCLKHTGIWTAYTQSIGRYTHCQ